MEREKKALLKEFKNNKDYIAQCLKMESVACRNPKSAESSETFRKNGNALYIQKGHDAETHRQIFNYYCQSVMTAPNSSEQLALAYGNRSAFLLHINKYEDCIIDCNRALKIANSDIFKIKILCRKAECLAKLGSPEFKAVLQEAECCKNKIEDDSDNRKSMTEIINKVNNLSISKKSYVRNKKVDKIELAENLNGIKIQRDEKYGRHLIAVKDYKPGDIIIVENLFAITPYGDFRYTNCHYCLKICWSGIPCKHCCFAIFCSEDCRHKAWKLFHDIECSTYYSYNMTDDEFELSVLRSIIIGINEAGNIAQLKADLKFIDKISIDGCSKGFIKDGEYTKNKLESVYVSDSGRVPDHIVECMVYTALKIVIRMTQCSKLFTNINLTDVDEFTNDKEVIFMGSLVTKILAVRSITDWRYCTNSLLGCEKSSSIEAGKCKQDKSCCIRGSCFMPISNLLSHHCFPNAAGCYSEDRKVILYAILPIQKNSQIFLNYNCKFDDTPLEERKLILEKCSVICDCQACVESWPALGLMSNEFKVKHGYSINSILERSIYKECSGIINALQTMSINFNKKDIKTLSKAIIQANELKKPSELMCLLIECLRRIYFHVYGLKLQLPSYGQCKI